MNVPPRVLGREVHHVATNVCSSGVSGVLVVVVAAGGARSSRDSMPARTQSYVNRQRAQVMDAQRARQMPLRRGQCR